MGGKLDRHSLRTVPAGAAPARTEQPPAPRTDPVAVPHGEIERDLGAFVAPLAAHSPAPRALAAAWVMWRATVLDPGLVDRTTKEATATAVALANSAWYCAEVHLAALESRNERRASDATDTDLAALADHRVRQITEWARTTGMRAGVGPQRPFGDHHVPELVGTVVFCHYLNRMATVFLPSPTFSGDAPASALADARPALDLIAAHANRTPGAAAVLDLLPEASLPEDLAWAVGQPDIAVAFARAAAAIDDAGARSVPESVRAVVSARLAGWRGEAPDPGQEWLTELVAELPAEDRPAARLALLTAFAPHQVDQPVLDMFGRTGRDERALVELTAWASFAAARRVGGWLSDGVLDNDTPSTVLPFRRRDTGRRPVAATGDGDAVGLTLTP
jgi:AhpD family alkylhydroperoxidase